MSSSIVQIPVYSPYLQGREAEYVQDCLTTGWVSSRGLYIPRFEREFAQFLGVGHATTVSNGTVALHLALYALGIGPGDEVIVPTFTYIASVNAIAMVGAKPVFVDSLPDNWNMDPDEVRAAITPRTRTVLAVHMYGAPCAMEPLLEICRSHGLSLIEDAAEAFGSSTGGRFVGTFGTFATFSFFGNKTITTGEGGMIVSGDAALIERAALLKSQSVSLTREYWHGEIGFNYRMTNICAALGVAQLEMADEILARKRRLKQWYQEALQGVPVVFQAEESDTVNSFWMVSVLTASERVRDGLRTYLQKHGVETRRFFRPAHTMPAFRSLCAFPVAESLGQRGLNLPSWPGLEVEQVDYVTRHIKGFLDGHT
jgi:perosamine synthetase